MLVGAHDGGVDDQVFEVRAFHQRIEDAFPNALLGPAAEALENAVPMAKRWWQITPRRTRTRDPQHSVDKQTIVLAMPALVAFFTRNKMLDPQPLSVRQFPPNKIALPSCDLESHSRVSGNPLYVNRT